MNLTECSQINSSESQEQSRHYGMLNLCDTIARNYIIKREVVILSLLRDYNIHNCPDIHASISTRKTLKQVLFLIKYGSF